MKEHSFKEEWPPVNVAVLAYCYLYEREPKISTLQPYPERRVGHYLLYWSIESGSVVWKDVHTDRMFYEVDIQKWWAPEK